MTLHLPHSVSLSLRSFQPANIIICVVCKYLHIQGSITYSHRYRHLKPRLKGLINTCRLAHLLSTVCPHQIWQDWRPPSDLRAGIGIVASLAADPTDPLGVLEPLVVPRLLADIAACGSTFLPGWSSVATTRTAATALTIIISPRCPPVLFRSTAGISAFFSATSAISPLRSRSKKRSVRRFRRFPLFQEVISAP